MQFYYRMISALLAWRHRQPAKAPVTSTRCYTPLSVALRRPWPGTLRGLLVWQFGIEFIAVGWFSYLGTEIPPITREYLAFPLSFLEPWMIGTWFVITGVFVMFTSYCHFGRDIWGLKAAALLALAWGLSYVMGFLFFDTPVRALGGSILWLGYAMLLFTCTYIPKIGLPLQTYAHPGDEGNR